MNDATLDPFDANRFHISTPMIQALHERLCQWLWCGFTGGLIIGEARSGKTRAISALDNTLSTRTGQRVPLHRVDIAQRDTATVRSLFANVALALGRNVGRHDTCDLLSDWVLHYLADASLTNDTRHVILMVDEAQYLTARQLSGFAEMYNKLQLMGVNLVVFFVANEDQIKPLAEALLEKKNDYLRERFFKQVYRFYGIRSHREVLQCLTQYDTTLEDKHPAITQQVLPKAYSEGFRLQQLSEPLWAMYASEYKTPLNLTSWRMQYFIGTVNILLMDYLPNYDSRDPEQVEQMIHHSLEASGLTPSLASVV
ncbi:ATP-binding protein [Pseudoteredinibacter isoporae]|uniref:ATP-binding protein n=1 Tax=Pseudoteredinibacter isoporae TaxID=570281 RepID=UPI003102C9BC